MRWNAEGWREVPRLAQAGVGAAPAKVEGAWLITGARGGVAQAIATWLANRGAGALVLVSRQQPQPPAGVTVPVHCHAGDAADADFIAGLLRQYQVQGVVHAAGQLADAAIAEQTEETIRAVARGKLGGALALDRATRAHPVQHFVLCSSVAGVVGSARQVNHAFCAAFLDGIAQRRQADGLPALSIDWGVWSGTGSAAALGFDQKAEQLGLGSIAPAQGTALFGRRTLRSAAAAHRAAIGRMAALRLSLRRQGSGPAARCLDDGPSGRAVIACRWAPSRPRPTGTRRWRASLPPASASAARSIRRRRSTISASIC